MAALLPGTHNSRDLGGLAGAGGHVRAGLVVRSEAPVQLGEEGRRALRELGIRTAIDLREPAERRLDDPGLEALGITVRHHPILGPNFVVTGQMTLEDVYWEMLERRGPALAGAVRALAGPGALPALIFCSAGKDRTGLVSALLLAALGVNEDEIVADYTATERNMDPAFRASVEARAIAAGISEQELAVKLGAPPALIDHVLLWLQRNHGGAAGYLLAGGLAQSELDALRRGLLEPLASAA